MKVTFEVIENIEINEGELNNSTLVAMMKIELEYMRHVNEVNDNVDIELFKNMPQVEEIKMMPSFTRYKILEWIRLAHATSYPDSMLDSTQKARLTYFIQEMGYNKVMNIAENTVNIWKDVFEFKE